MSEIFYQKKTNDSRIEGSPIEEIWYKVVNNQIVLHNDDGPAVVRTFHDDNGNETFLKEYRKDGLIHREDGPAVIHPFGYKEYFYKGHNLENLSALAKAKGLNVESWAELVAFAKREKI